MVVIREFIIQWSKGNLDLFEYTKEKEIVLILTNTYILEIINYISQYKDNCHVWIERVPMYVLIQRELRSFNIPFGINSDAERWQSQIHQTKLPHMQYISHWQIHKPTRLEDIEQMTFDYEKWKL